MYASIRSPQKLLFNRPERGALPVTSGLFLWRVVSVWSGDPFKRRVVMGGLFYTPWTIVAWTHCETVHRAVQLVSENARFAGQVRSKVERHVTLRTLAVHHHHQMPHQCALDMASTKLHCAGAPTHSSLVRLALNKFLSASPQYDNQNSACVVSARRPC